MADILSRLAGPTALASGANTVLTVTAAHTYGARSIRVQNNTTATVSFKVGINGIADANLIIPNISLAPGSVYHDEGLFVLVASDTLNCTTSGTGLTMTVSGIDHS
jgi:hypothetical protein